MRETIMSRTDVEESPKIVVFSLRDTSLFEQAENSGVAQSGFIYLEKLEAVNKMIV